MSSLTHRYIFSIIVPLGGDFYRTQAVLGVYADSRLAAWNIARASIPAATALLCDCVA